MKIDMEILHDEKRRKDVNKKIILIPQVYEPEPGRETPEEKRLREVDFKNAGIIVILVNLQNHPRQTSNDKITIKFLCKGNGEGGS